MSENKFVGAFLHNFEGRNFWRSIPFFPRKHTKQFSFIYNFATLRPLHALPTFHLREMKKKKKGKIGVLTRLRAAGSQVASGGGRFLDCARTREMRRKVGEVWISLVVFRMYVRRVRNDILEIISVLAVRKTPLFEKENVLNRKRGVLL